MSAPAAQPAATKPQALTPPPPTPQTLDPLGGLTARLMVVLAAATSLGVAAAALAVGHDEVASPALQAAAVTLLAAACILFFIRTSAFRAPFGRREHVALYILLTTAVVLDLASRWGYGAALHHAWGPFAMAIILVVTGSYRPAREIVVLTVTSTLIVAAIAVLVSAHVAGDTSVLRAPLVAVAPMLGTGLGAAAFSRSLVRSLQQWRTRAEGSRRNTLDGLREELAPTVRAERLALLDSEIRPFLHGLLDRGTLTVRESEQARELASSLRSTIILETGGSWLDAVADEVTGPTELADLMTSEQRASLRAMIGALTREGRGTLMASLERVDQSITVTLAIASDDSATQRGRLAPYFAVAQGYFASGSIDHSNGMTTLTFGFQPARSS